MSRSRNALDRTVWWDAHLDRPARSPAGEVGQQSAYGVTEDGGFRIRPGVQGIEGGRHRK